MALPLLSVIIPVYNEERRLPGTLAQLHNFLKQQPYQAEVLVVENGSQDRTFELACAFAEQHSCVRVLRENRRGKGLAVQRGMLEAQGEYRFMCDADFSMPVEQINCFLPPSLSPVEIAIASREAPGAVRYNEPEYRHVVGRIFNWMIRLLVLPGLHDTQCGFKCFRADVAEQIFPLQTLTGWSFDVEVLYIARRRGYRIQEVPVPWYFNAESKISVLRDSGRMLFDLINIRWNALRGRYAAQG